MKSNKELAIEKSIYTYQSIILLDSNLRVKLTDEHDSYGVKIVNWQDNNLLLELYQSQLNLTLTKKYGINMLTSHSTFASNILVLKKIIQDDVPFYATQFVSPIHQKRPRNHFRQDVAIPVTIIIIAPKNSKVKSTPIKGTTIDISAGGLKFISNTIMKPPLNVYITFIFHNSRFTTKAKILEQIDKLNHNQYIYRVMFKDMDANMQSKLEKQIIDYSMRH